jgi:hypothetical protein
MPLSRYAGSAFIVAILRPLPQLLRLPYILTFTHRHDKHIFVSESEMFLVLAFGGKSPWRTIVVRAAVPSVRERTVRRMRSRFNFRRLGVVLAAGALTVSLLGLPAATASARSEAVSISSTASNAPPDLLQVWEYWLTLPWNALTHDQQECLKGNFGACLRDPSIQAALKALNPLTFLKVLGQEWNIFWHSLTPRWRACLKGDFSACRKLSRHKLHSAPRAPTGLAVRPDPGNNTVLLLTWRDNARNETAFDVSNGVRSRSAPGNPGTGTVHYTWTGLKPGSWTCFKVRATNHLGHSAWDPNTAPWYVCASTPAPPPGPCTPRINTVGPVASANYTAVEVTGSCFGTGNTASRADTDYFRISDLTAGWNACWTGDPGTDQVTCNILTWNNTTIVFDGFTGGYGQNGWVISNGDRVKFQVWNPQSGKGPASCEVIVGSGATTHC